MSEPDQKIQPSVKPQDPEQVIQEVAQEEAATAQPNDALVSNEEKTYELEELRIKLGQLEQELKEAKDLHGQRKLYIRRMFALIVAWLTIVVIFVALSASAKNQFSLSDSVLIAFITSTTVSVLGMFIIAAKWLFSSSQKNETESKKKE